MKITRRQLRLLFIAGVILGVAVMPTVGLLANWLTDPVQQSGTVSFGASDGPQATLNKDTNFSGTDVYQGPHQIQYLSEAGNITLTSQSRTNVTVDQMEGTWTETSGLNVTQASLKINPEDKPAMNVSGDATQFDFRNPTADDGTVDFIYNGSTGTTTVTVRSLSANTAYRAVDADSGNVLDIAQTDSTGTATFEEMTNSEHRVLLKTGDATPILSDPQPDGNVSSQPSKFSVHVEDEDFTGDNVTLVWRYDGSKIDTTYATSNGRYNTTAVPSISSGVHDWSVVATDENGNEAVLNATVGLPGTLYIRNETNASQLVDSPVEVTVEFQNGTVVTERTTTSGTLDMTGLPTTDFLVTVNASQDFYARTVYFQSIIGDSSVYLLNKSYKAYEDRFKLEDPTGQFPSESFVIIKKPINRSGTKKYRTIYSDRFGVEGVTADLQADERYQISIRNPSGTVQEVGPYRADVSETVTVRPGTPNIELGEYEDGWASAASLDNRTLEYRYDDPENKTQRVTVWIHEKGNTSNQLRPNVSYYDLGSFSGTRTLTENESEKTWVVNFVITRDNEKFTASETVANKADLVPELSREWRLITGIAILLISAGIFSMLNAGVGGVVVAIEGGVLWWTGWLDGATSGAAVVLALFVAVIYHLYRASGP